ncbi:MAG: phosphatase PAP2 family protein [Patescibacteria group bacterium]|nr:phosphatase PAP2 family protein [Patescibacteria group bacterium]
MGINLFGLEIVDGKEKRKKSAKVAEIISSVFDPLILAIVGLFLVLQKSDGISSSVEFFSWFLAVMVVGILPPLGFLIYRLQTGKIQDWFITNRAERKAILLVVLISSLLLVVLITLLQGPRLLLAFSLILFFINLLISLLTLYWKISVHTNAITTFILILVLLYGVEYWLSLFLIPLVGWARWELGKHTLSQVVGGSFISVMVFLTVFKIFNYI